MKKDYITVYTEGTGEYIEKKSRFIGTLFHVTSEEEAEARLSEVRKHFYDASHHCYAYVLGPDRKLVKCSDQGEPSGTAGQPILSVLNGEELTDAMIIVTRYFGGTLLGTGGLVRSYTKAAREAVSQSTLVHKYPAELLLIRTDYQGLGKLQYMFSEESLSPTEILYEENVKIKVPVPEERTEEILKKVSDITNGKAEISKEREILFGKVGKEILLFG